MNRQPNNFTPARVFVLVLLLLTTLLASCGGDDPVAPVVDDPVVNRAPGVPTIDTAEGAPADGAVDVATTMMFHWDCTDPDGDALTYTFLFASNPTPTPISTDQASNQFGPMSMLSATTFSWQVVAKDPDGLTTVSPVWSFTTAAPDVETVSLPGTPAGPATGEILETLTYTVTAATSSMGHTVGYTFDWGDGSTPTNTQSTTRNHIWSTAGTYDIRVKASCAEHPEIESAWSPVTQVMIADPGVETIETPPVITGATTGVIGLNVNFASPVVVTSEGHNVEYRFDSGAGEITNWSAIRGVSFIWSTAGVYEVKTQARCALHPEIESGWSPPLAVTIQGETAFTPNLEGPLLGGVADDITFSAEYGATSLTHPVENRFDWGDGTYSEWAPAPGSICSATHAWTAVGTYAVRAQTRCLEHPDVISDWTEAINLVISATESISTPTIHGASEITFRLGTWGDLTPTNAVSNMGHAVEYQFDWGNGTLSEWRNGSATQVPTDVEGDFQVRLHARCLEHPDVVSDWSAVVLVHVVDIEVMQGYPSLTGPFTGTAGVPVVFTATGLWSSHDHELEYQLYISTALFTPGVGQGWTTADNLTYTWDSPGTGFVSFDARCALHPEVISSRSAVHVITITD
jgi:hypothetical protein